MQIKVRRGVCAAPTRLRTDDPCFESLFWQVCLFAAAKDAGARRQNSPRDLLASSDGGRGCARPCATAGVPELKLELDDGASTSTLVNTLRTQYPQLERILPRCALAINGEYVQDAEPGLADGDEVALLPPMSGG